MYMYYFTFVSEFFKVSCTILQCYKSNLCACSCYLCRSLKWKKKAAFKRKMCVKEVKWHNPFVFLAVWVFITFETLWFSMFKNRKTWFSSIFWVAKTDTKIFCLFEFNWIIIKNLLKQFQQILQKENYQRLISGYYFY